MWQSIFTNKQTVLLQCMGKIMFTIEIITMLCFVLSLYDKNRFILTIYFCIICFVFQEPVFFTIVWGKFFFSICDQIINFHVAF